LHFVLSRSDKSGKPHMKRKAGRPEAEYGGMVYTNKFKNWFFVPVPVPIRVKLSNIYV
jgi:hypothetical protein